MNVREVLIITDPQTVKVLSEETRFKILKLLREHPMTVNELSHTLRRDRTTIYRHIKALENVGLVEEFDNHRNEKVYARTARMFLIKAEPDESIVKFREAYLQIEAEKLVRILEKAGFNIRDREELRDLAKEVLNDIELNSQPVINRISQAKVELTEIELFHLLNMLVFMQSCEFCDRARRIRKLIEL